VNRPVWKEDGHAEEGRRDGGVALGRVAAGFSGRSREAGESPLRSRVEELLLSLKDRFAEKRYAEVVEIIEQLLDLRERGGVSLPAEIEYYHALSLSGTGRNGEALELLSAYLDRPDGDPEIVLDARELKRRIEREREAGKSGAEAPASRSGFKALCVGLRYPGTRDSLDFSTKDVKQAAEAFRLASGFDGKACRIETLVDDESKSDKPTPAAIKRRLACLAGEAGPNDRLVFFFSGHGLLAEDGESSLLVAHGGRDLRDPLGILPLAEVRGILGRSRAREKLVIVDACHSGGKGADDGGLTPASVAKSLGNPGGKSASGLDEGRVAWLVSCAANEKSWEDEESGNGLFTRFLLETLGREADSADTDFDGALSLSEIHYNVNLAISAYLKGKRDSRDPVWTSRRQSPQAGLDKGDANQMKLFYVQDPNSPPAPANLPVPAPANLPPPAPGDGGTGKYVLKFGDLKKALAGIAAGE
jgi:hypothetical protein